MIDKHNLQPYFCSDKHFFTKMRLKLLVNQKHEI